MNKLMTVDIEILKMLPDNSSCHVLLNNKKFYFKFFIDIYGLKIMVIRDDYRIYHIYNEDWHKVIVLDKEMYLN